MKTTASLLLLATLAACSSGHGIDERDTPEPHGTAGAAHTFGAAGASSAGGAAGGAPSGLAGALPAGDRYCRQLLEYQEAGGFWCEFLAGAGGAGGAPSFGEASNPSACRWCYLARCGADGFTHWVPVECGGL